MLSADYRAGRSTLREATNVNTPAQTEKPSPTESEGGSRKCTETHLHEAMQAWTPEQRESFLEKRDRLLGDPKHDSRSEHAAALAQCRRLAEKALGNS